MSKALGLSVLRNDYRGARVPVMEHFWPLSREALRHFTGIDPLASPRRIRETFRRILEVFEIDLIWGGGVPSDDELVFDWSDGQRVKRNAEGLEVVQWGIFGTCHQEDGRHFNHIPRPTSVDAALDFDPQRWFPESVEQYRQRFQREYDAMLESVGELACPLPHHYTTCFHWPLAVFGFEMFCEAGLEEDRFARLMERFAEVSRRVTTAWSQVRGLHGFILHDDLAMTGGPIFAPDWYRRHIFPHYPGIFEPLRSKQIPIIFTSDGDCSLFVDDIFAAGADGLNFEYVVDLERLVEDYREKILIGNLSSHTLQHGPIERIEREVRRCMEVGARARRFVVNVGGQLTHDIPIAHLEFYLHLRRRLAREMRGSTCCAS